MRSATSKTLLRLLLGSTTIHSVSTFKHETTQLAYRSTDASFGSLHIINSCNQPFKARSVGAYPSNSSRDAIEYPLPAGHSYREHLRETVPISKAEASEMVITHVAPIDPATGKIKGQGISFMITTPSNTDWGHGITQIEYSLVQNPENNDPFKRLWYDISLLNCAEPAQGVTDMQASQDATLNQKKVDGCPGYQNGIAMWTSDPQNCRPVYCDGLQYCEAVYNYDKTKLNEASLACAREYQGDLFVELCAGNGNGTNYGVYEKWRQEGNVENVIVPHRPALNISTPSSAGVRFPNSTAFQQITSVSTPEARPFGSGSLGISGTQVKTLASVSSGNVSLSNLTTDASGSSTVESNTVESFSSQRSTVFSDSYMTGLDTKQAVTTAGLTEPVTTFVWPGAASGSIATGSTEEDTVDTVWMTEYTTITCAPPGGSRTATLSGGGCGLR